MSPIIYRQTRAQKKNDGDKHKKHDKKCFKEICFDAPDIELKTTDIRRLDMLEKIKASQNHLPVQMWNRTQFQKCGTSASRNPILIHDHPLWLSRRNSEEMFEMGRNVGLDPKIKKFQNYQLQSNNQNSIASIQCRPAEKLAVGTNSTWHSKMRIRWFSGFRKSNLKIIMWSPLIFNFHRKDTQMETRQ